MNADFQRTMLAATRLTRAGDLQAATALIQAALHGQPSAHPPTFTPAPSTPFTTPFTAPLGTHRPQADVIDIPARVVSDPAPASPSPGAAPEAPVRTAAPAAASSADPLAEPGVGPRAGRRAARRVLAALKSLAPSLDGLADPLQAPAPHTLPDAEPYGPGEGRFVHGSHTEAGGTRAFKLFVPPERHGSGLPLVVMLHGCTQHPDDFAAGTGMNEAAREQGFFVLYPAQSAQMNPQRCWNWFKHSHQARGRGEAALLAGMVQAVVSRHGLDPERVYVAGLSAGGAMAAVLGAAYPDVFAAVGVHSGLPVGVARDLPGALAAMQGQGQPAAAGEAAAPPTIVFHGDSDAIVHPVNGEQAVAACAITTRAAEVEHGSSRGGRRYTRRTWRNAAGHPMAEHWSVHGAGHAWAGGRREGSYTDAQGPDATAAMLRFFLAHRLQRRG
ncbi:extracellular catalytic domain type 1 short-chain-length polyhydroxyalkanoate depolymerase [Azohydromonas lata]|uniref:PHB depolymerase family esterase n=1 Tax=Azohydromonas lata TaxID=45677 RepID=A0ABU5IB94_9BURK|nr:PHB depolymerase family esterase [Azohydromonas lata]MDZ5455940.1 PHB depolymerase family esterase [Azohydromonas lata]